MLKCVPERWALLGECHPERSEGPQRSSTLPSGLELFGQPSTLLLVFLTIPETERRYSILATHPYRALRIASLARDDSRRDGCPGFCHHNRARAGAAVMNSPRCTIGLMVETLKCTATAILCDLPKRLPNQSTLPAKRLTTRSIVLPLDATAAATIFLPYCVIQRSALCQMFRAASDSGVRRDVLFRKRQH